MYLTAFGYIAYLAVAVLITSIVGRTLRREGLAYLSDSFKHKPGHAAAVSHLVAVAFYLLTGGIVLLFMRTGRPSETVVDLFASVGMKLGGVLLVVGLLYLAHFAALSAVRKSANRPTGPQFGQFHHVQPQFAPPAQPSRAASGQPR